MDKICQISYYIPYRIRNIPLIFILLYLFTLEFPNRSSSKYEYIRIMPRYHNILQFNKFHARFFLIKTSNQDWF